MILSLKIILYYQLLFVIDFSKAEQFLGLIV